MSLWLEFTPHSWYMGWAIKDNRSVPDQCKWIAYVDDGNTYRVIERESNTLQNLKQQIKAYEHNYYVQ